MERGAGLQGPRSSRLRCDSHPGAALTLAQSDCDSGPLFLHVKGLSFHVKHFSPDGATGAPIPEDRVEQGFGTGPREPCFCRTWGQRWGTCLGVEICSPDAPKQCHVDQFRMLGFFCTPL